MCPWRNWHRCQMLLPGQTLRKRSWSVQFHFPMPTSLPEIQHPGPGSPAPCRDICMAYAICSSSVILLKSGRPVWPNSCWLMVIFSRASSESAKRKRWQGRADGMSHTGPPTNWFLSCQTPPCPLQSVPLPPSTRGPRTADSTSCTFSPRGGNPSLSSRGCSRPPCLLLLPLPLLFHRNTKGLAKGRVRSDFLLPSPLLGTGEVG